jgi:hypothetical protein
MREGVWKKGKPVRKNTPKASSAPIGDIVSRDIVSKLAEAGMWLD